MDTKEVAGIASVLAGVASVAGVVSTAASAVSDALELMDPMQEGRDVFPSFSELGTVCDRIESALRK